MPPTNRPTRSDPTDRTGETARLAALLRGRWPSGATARLQLKELSSCGLSLLTLETRGSEDEWVRRVQLRIPGGLAAALAADLGVELHEANGSL